MKVFTTLSEHLSALDLSTNLSSAGRTNITCTEVLHIAPQNTGCINTSLSVSLAVVHSIYMYLWK